MMPSWSRKFNELYYVNFSSLYATYTCAFVLLRVSGLFFNFRICGGNHATTYQPRQAFNLQPWLKFAPTCSLTRSLISKFIIDYNIILILTSQAFNKLKRNFSFLLNTYIDTLHYNNFHTLGVRVVEPRFNSKFRLIASPRVT